MKLPSLLEAHAALTRLLSRLRGTTGWGTKNPLWRHYARAQHGRESALPRRLAFDLALLGGAALIPSIVFFWAGESEQQKLARLPLEAARYVEGWQMEKTHGIVYSSPPAPIAQGPASNPSSQDVERWQMEKTYSHVFFGTPLSTALEPSSNPSFHDVEGGWQTEKVHSHVFFGTPLPTAHEPASAADLQEASAEKEASAEISQGWSIRCGQLYETFSFRRPPLEQGALATQIRHWRCVGGARVTTNNATLSTEALDYENKTQGYHLTTDLPIFVQMGGGARRFSALGGGIVEKNGDMHLFRQVSFQMPGLEINAQGGVLGKILTQYRWSKNVQDRPIRFQRDVDFSFQALSKRYRGISQRMKLLPCSPSSEVACRIFGNDAFRRVVLKGSIVLSEEDDRKGVLWTLQADRVIVQNELARYEGKKLRRGSLGRVRILLTNGTQLTGLRGGYDLSQNSGLLCGAVEVRSGESVLNAACLRYNLTEQRYSLESSASEQELSKRFFSF